MALISISGLTNKKLVPDTGSDVEFDGYLNVTPVTSNIVTRRPIEDGFDINDAVHNNPTVLSVEIIITDTAQTIFDARSITNIGNITGTKFFQTHTKRQLNNLDAISRNRSPIELVTKYNTYTDYIIESFSYTETIEQGLRITFNLVEARTNEDFDPSENISDSIGLWS